MSDDEISQGPERWDRPALELPRGLVTAGALAVAAAIMSWAALSGFGLLSGSAYISVTGSSGGPEDTRQLLAGLVGAGLSCLPLLLGATAARRATEQDAGWVPSVARGAALVAAVAVVLRVVAAVAQYLTGDGYFYYG